MGVQRGKLSLPPEGPQRVAFLPLLNNMFFDVPLVLKGIYHKLNYVLFSSEGDGFCKRTVFVHGIRPQKLLSQGLGPSWPWGELISPIPKR